MAIAHDRYTARCRPWRSSPTANARTTLFAQIETRGGGGERRRDRRGRRRRLPVGRPFRPQLLARHPGPVRPHGVHRCDRPRSPRPAAKHDKALGRLVPTSTTGSRYTSQGFDFICYSGDVWALYGAVQAGSTRSRRADRKAGGRGKVGQDGRQKSDEREAVMSKFRVALSRRLQEAGRHRRPIPDFDLAPLEQDPGVEHRLHRRQRRSCGHRPRGLRRADPADPPVRAGELPERAAGSPSSPASASATTMSTSQACTDAGMPW